MGIIASIKGNMALKAHNKGDLVKARKLYEEAIAGGLLSARPMLGYAILLIRAGEYEEAMELLKKTQKAPDLTPERRSQLFVDYAACLAKQGQLRKGVQMLERQHDRNPTGLTYETLGYLYVEYLLPENRPVADENTEITAEEGEELPEGELTVEQKQAILDKRWQALIVKAHEMLKSSVDYDDESAVSLDNMGQFLYRVLGDVEGAKEWFEKANAEKPEQVDSLWFLSRYDLEAGDTAAAIEKLETALEGRFSPLNYADKPMIEAELAQLKKQ